MKSQRPKLRCAPLAVPCLPSLGRSASQRGVEVDEDFAHLRHSVDDLQAHLRRHLLRHACAHRRVDRHLHVNEQMRAERTAA
eukprot:CAMPEP_0205856320 /NCGR_PEP_ID=MMETSP1083-20121108/3062_1 /ASSEMBLY_ACC=CAM_ASM_000430 /TAXON_ID=97485 /ORGANISM="Prymnesium parvum, Strain Texoma1" /LENGTH=81 /DNA_ID=CAMNT_0053217727 /DNA_START=492 /DNA_END=737 /DNA_ORIENTATION=-